MSDLRAYAAVTAAYWAFTLTDGALRVLVLLHFHTLGYGPLEVASLFLLYEVMGIVTNFAGGWLGARYGLRLTLLLGLGVQVFALVMLSLVQPDWALALSVGYVMVAQALSGVAKDLTKMSSKSAVKLVAGEGALFRWVAMLTGSKNALKGVGFLLGGVLLQTLGFQGGLWLMAGALALVLLASLVTVHDTLGRAKESKLGRHLFSKSREINLLSAARIVLFASRDVWFVVGVPLFLYERMGWSFAGTAGFLAAWVIGYGIVQAAVPSILRRTNDAATAAQATRLWGVVLAALPALIAAALTPGLLGGWIDDRVALIGGLALFAPLFAINSALHSYLIVAYSDADKVALNVGFYYMANAVGRLGGTFLSGLVYQVAGLTACLWVSAAFLVIAAAVALALPTTGAARGRAVETSSP
jgi:predicted MFS family arabinose efflux permease